MCKEMNTEKLDALMQIKKKSDASKTQKSEFVSLIIGLIKENGYSDQVEEYLFSGYSFAGVKPVIDIINKMSLEERTDFIEQVLSGKLYSINEKGISFKLLVDLFTQFIVCFPQDKSTISKLIKSIPAKSKVKTGQLLGDAPKVIDKYFLSVIRENTQLPSFESLELSNDDIKRFTDLFLFILQSIKASKKISEKKIKNVLEWLAATNVNQSVSVDSKDNTSSTMPKQADNKNAEIKPLSSYEFENLCKRVLLTLDCYKALEKESALLNARITTLEKELETKKTQLENLKTKTNESEKALTEQINRNNSLLEELNEVKTEKNKLQGIVDIYSEDKESSQTEQLNAIASKLKAEYRDFQDALEMEMTVELGENIKEQVIQIFKILAKAGIDVESR